MSILKLSLKVLGTHLIMSLIQVALMPAFFGILQKNEVYQWIIGIIYIAIFWLVIYADTSSKGLDDAKADKYKPYKGFIAGLIACIPAFILYIGALVYPTNTNGINWFQPALRIWLVPYIKIFTSFEEAMPHIAMVMALLLPLVTGISYMDGLRKRQKILMAIEKTDALRNEKSKLGLYNKKNKDK